MQKFDGSQGTYTVNLRDLANYWLAGANDQQIQEQLEWFGDALEKAKKLREDNNYEGLLIAHEYRHNLQASFKGLAAIWRESQNWP